ncbi:hypothetical protein [Umezawaea sp. Da 62-37]|uniref:hypothetical protein n=1 Tax=Umezawaea sp. Da 62-37 TaxID=3075927 RepID=UPI0028F70CEE|nr:hypothetical protein [Umezawaea sp. Da 62-37]WNV91112.1 hypothetical protein RM788_23385 [Umezawaea sp. Da 62-37]
MSEVEPESKTPSIPADVDMEAITKDAQAILGGLSITDLESDIGALLDDRMGKLEEMLDGLDALVARIEGEMDQQEGLADPPQ